MRRTKLVGLTAVAMSALTMLIGGFTSRSVPAGRPVLADRTVPAGREVFKIVGTTPGPLHAKVTAKGEFSASGYFLRKKASLIFPKGRIVVWRRVHATTYSPPDLATCRFKIVQNGTFHVRYATGKYQGLHDRGRFWTHVSARLKRTGPNQCGSKIVYYHFVTYEIGKIS